MKTAFQTIAEQNASSVRILDNDFVHEDFVKVIVQTMNTGLGSNLDATKVIQKMNTDEVVLIVVNKTWQTAMLVKHKIAELETLHQPALLQAATTSPAYKQLFVPPPLLRVSLQPAVIATAPLKL